MAGCFSGWLGMTSESLLIAYRARKGVIADRFLESSGGRHHEQLDPDALPLQCRGVVRLW